jgi:type I restriction-modification system DNA methylase subunit
MSEDQKKQLEQQLWNIANTLRGKMNADEFRDYILGFIFNKYLSERMNIYANSILKADKIKYRDIKENSKQGKEYIQAIREESLEKLGYFLKPSELFSEVAKRGNSDKEEDESNFILEDLQKILTNIQQSTMGTESEEDFDPLFEDMDLNSTKLGKTPEARNAIIAKVLSHLDKIDFKLEQTELDVLGDAYEYLIAQFASGEEQHIRRYFIEDKNYLDAVIGLPANLFYGTPIPTCIMVFNKCRENPEDVLFINAAKHFERGTQNTLRQEDIDRIINTYRNRKEVPKYSSLATLEFIAENEYNLNIPRYVNTFEEEEKIDIAAVAKQLKSLEKEMKNTDAELMAFCKELKIDTPF